MDELAKLFGSLARVKLLRLFIFNRHQGLDSKAIALRSKLSKARARDELAHLIRIGIVQKTGRGKEPIYRANPNYPHFDALAAFIRGTAGVSRADLLKHIRKAGSVRLILLSGVFTGATESPIDILVAGERLDERALARATHAIEAELGQEVRYAAFTTEDFRYRLGIYDRLLRDVLDYPHEALLDHIGL